MRTATVTFSSDGSEIKYVIDLETNSFKTTLSTFEGGQWKEEVTEKGSLGDTPETRQGLALRVYHILLAALRRGV